jgi:hypothetical protein
LFRERGSKRDKAYSVEPQSVRFSFGAVDGPFASIGTDGIFPLGLYLVLKAVEICTHLQLARVIYVVVKAANVIIITDELKYNNAPYLN